MHRLILERVAPNCIMLLSTHWYTYRKPGGSCSYVSHHYKSQCSQVYNYHRLLSWDKTRGLHMDIYKVNYVLKNVDQ